MTDQEHVVLRIPRPDGGELRVLRKTYNGSAPFTSLHRYYLDEASDELRPGKQNCTIRDADLRAVEERNPPLRLLPGSRGEIEINTTIVRRFLGVGHDEFVELTAFTDAGIQVAQCSSESAHLELLREAERLRGFRGVYQLVNGPIDPRLGARYEPNRWHRATNGRATDKDIQALRAVFIDVDPERPKGISATDDEQRAACEVSLAIEEWIAASLGRAALGHGCSGNGYFTLIALDPCAWSAETTAGIARFLALLNKRFAAPGVKIDTSVANPARLMPAPGTWKRKGRNTEERPHRMTSFICKPTVRRVPLREVIA